MTEARIAATPRSNEDTKPIAVADIFRLAKAMPSVPDMPGILLELDRIAEETGVEFQSVTPLASAVVGDFQTVPITLAFDGNFYELSDFLFRLRTLVGVRRGRAPRLRQALLCRDDLVRRVDEGIPGARSSPLCHCVRLRERRPGQCGRTG